jgi:hypothetical protein
MPKKKNTKEDQTSVRVGNISDVSGNVNIAGRNITTHQTTNGVNLAELGELFNELYRNIDALPAASPALKEDITEDVKDIQAVVTEAAQKNEKVEEGFLARRFRNIARMAPDILDMVVAMLANPLAGMGVAAGKLAEKAKEEARQKTS